MSHFRLKRRARLLVDHLSLMLFVPPGLILRAVFPHPTTSVCAALVHRHPFHIPLRHSSKRTFHKARLLVVRRPYLALTALLLALSLLVSGCEFAREADLQFDSPAPIHATPSSLLSTEKLSFNNPAQVEEGLASSTIPNSDPRLLARPAPNEAKPLPWAIPESVFFLYRSSLSGMTGIGRRPLATAFVLSVPDPPHRQLIRFLVTARHVVDPQWARCAETNPTTIDLRLNRRSGGVGYETVSLQSQGHHRFFTSFDPTADIAVMLLDQQLIPNIDDYKFIDIPFRMLPTDAEIRQFRAAQPVMTARVVTQSPGESGSFPVFDAGVLSKISTEAVDVQCGAAPGLQQQTKSLHVWLINIGAPQGVSGAPVYTAIVRGIELEKTPVLLGIQSVAGSDQGIAGITPSTVLADLIQTALHENKSHLDFYRGPALVSSEAAPSLY